MDILFYVCIAIALVVGGGILSYLYARKVKEDALKVNSKIGATIKKM